MSYLGKVRPTVALTSDDITDGAVVEAKIGGNAVTSAKINDGAIVNADLNTSAAIALSKLATDPSNASNLSSGTVPTARLGSGTASSSTFLRGDQTYAAAGGGKVAQVVMGTTTTSTATTSTSYIDSTLTVDITPSATSSKVLVLGSQRLQTQSSDSNTHSRWQLLRDTTVIVPDLRWSSRASSSTDTVLDGDVSICYLDSPSTTSATTYKVQFRVNSGDQATAQNDSGTSTIIALEITT